MNEFKIGDIVKIKINGNSTSCFGVVESMLCFNNQICVVTGIHKTTGINHKNSDGYAYYIKPLNFHTIMSFTWSSNLMIKYQEDNCWDD